MSSFIKNLLLQFLALFFIRYAVIFHQLGGEFQINAFLFWGNVDLIRLVSALGIIVSLMWLYSFFYKGHLVGNILLALVWSIMPILALFDVIHIYVVWISRLSVFIFLNVLSIEIIKDTEDFENSVVFDNRSLTFLMGDWFTKWTIISINSAILFVPVAYHFFSPQKNISWLSLIYMLILMIAPVVYANIRVYRATVGNDFRVAGRLMRVVMVAGIGYCVGFSDLFFF